MKRVYLIAVMVLCLVFAVSAGATTVTFTPGANAHLNGTSFGGFTFNGEWWTNNDGRNAPYMEYYNQAHSLVYDAGTFTFNSMVLNGWPWENYGGGYGNILTMDFRALDGSLIAERTISLTLDNTWHAFAENIYGVHEIYFPATGGFWPRLDSITMDNSPVPEPSTFVLIAAGLAGLGILKRRRS